MPCMSFAYVHMRLLKLSSTISDGSNKNPSKLSHHLTSLQWNILHWALEAVPDAGLQPYPETGKGTLRPDVHYNFRAPCGLLKISILKDMKLNHLNGFELI